MFEDDRPPSGFSSQWAIAGLALLSLTALIVTAWLLADFGHEQRIVEQLTRQLPDSSVVDAHQLAGDLRLQARLAILLILNIVASSVALSLLVRAYISSERSLRKVRVLATDILACLDQGVITTDRDAMILSINPRGRELLNHAGNGTEFALSDLPNEHRPLEELCREVLSKHHTVGERAYVIHPGGTSRYLRAGCSLLRDHDQREIGAVIHIRDATEKTLMEQRLRRMERYMGLGSLAAGLQHEIKNPLSALSLHVQLLNEALNDGQPAAVSESLQVLNDEVRRIASVLESFRDFASIATLNRTEVDAALMIGKLVKLTEPQARQSGIRIVTELPVGESFPLFVDSVRLEQVLLNLIVNAFAAMPDGGTMTLRLRRDEHSTIIEVADTGKGIPEDFRDKVFEPYFTTRTAGTGMGLALSEKIVRQHGGTIEFQSGSTGTVFSVFIPRDGP